MTNYIVNTADEVEKSLREMEWGFAKQGPEKWADICPLCHALVPKVFFDEYTAKEGHIMFHVQIQQNFDKLWEAQ